MLNDSFELLYLIVWYFSTCLITFARIVILVVIRWLSRIEILAKTWSYCCTQDNFFSQLVSIRMLSYVLYTKRKSTSCQTNTWFAYRLNRNTLRNVENSYFKNNNTSHSKVLLHLLEPVEESFWYFVKYWCGSILNKVIAHVVSSYN